MSVNDKNLKSFLGRNAQCVQPYDEYNKKAGVQWEASRRVTAASAGQVFNAIMQTGDSTVDLKRREFAYTGAGLVASVYTNPTYTGGTPATAYNMRPGSTNTSGVTLLVEPTVTNNGTQVGADIYAIGPNTNQTTGSTVVAYATNRILEPNTTYLLVITAEDAQDIAARIEWYEGVLDFDADA